MPTPQFVDGSTITGTDGFLGSANRVAVPTVPAGATTAPLPRPGQPGYDDVERLAFRRFGSGRNLLLVMGQDGSMTWWLPAFLSQLATHYRVTIFDLPGVGYSPPPAGPLTLDVMADDTAGLIESLGLVRPTVLGWGLGGAVALALAERHPGSAGAIVLADAFAGGSASDVPPLAARSRLDSVWATPRSLSGLMFSNVHHLERGAWLLAIRRTVPDAVTHQAIVAEAGIVTSIEKSSELVRGLGSIAVPTMVVDGAKDRLVPPAASTAIATAIPRATQMVYPGADYGAIFEEQAAFLPSLEAFTG